MQTNQEEPGARRPRRSLSHPRTVVGMVLLGAIGLGACGSDGPSPHALSATAKTEPSAAAAAASPASAGPTTAAPTAPPTTSKAAATSGRAGPATRAKVASAPKPAAGTPGAPAAAPSPGPAARRTPSGPEVNQFISELQAKTSWKASPTQVADAGRAVCTAFDQGKTYAQVKEAALAMAGSYRYLVPKDVPDWAARRLVAMHCPGYTAKIK